MIYGVAHGVRNIMKLRGMMYINHICVYICAKRVLFDIFYIFARRANTSSVTTTTTILTNTNKPSFIFGA